MDWQALTSYLAANWLPLLISLLIGFVLGWLILGLPASRRSRRLEEQVAELDSKLKQTERALADARSQQDKLQAAYTASEQSLAEVRQQVTDLEAELQDKSTALEELEGELEAAKKAAEEIEELRATVDDKETALNEVYLRIAEMQRQLEDRKFKLSETEHELEESRANVTILVGQKADLEDKLEQVRGDVAGELALMTSTMIRMKDEELREARVRLAAVSRERDALRVALGSEG